MRLLKYKIAILFSLLLISWGAEAHQPDLSSTVLVQQGENAWALQVSSSLTAFEFEIARNFGDSAYATPEEFQSLVLSHVQNNVSILLNGSEEIQLQNGIVKLGHETNVIFQIVPALKNIETLTIHNGSFGDISHNKGLVYIIKDGFAKEQFILNNANGQTISLMAGDGKFELIQPKIEQSHASTWGIIIALIVIAILGGGILKIKRSTSKL